MPGMLGRRRKTHSQRVGNWMTFCEGPQRTGRMTRWTTISLDPQPSPSRHSLNPLVLGGRKGWREGCGAPASFVPALLLPSRQCFIQNILQAPQLPGRAEALGWRGRGLGCACWGRRMRPLVQPQPSPSASSRHSPSAGSDRPRAGPAGLRSYPLAPTPTPE
jgi:hypothetical protein